MRYSSSAHTRFYHRFHVVRVTKNRYKVLQGPMRERKEQCQPLSENAFGADQPETVWSSQLFLFCPIFPCYNLRVLVKVNR